MSLAASCLRLTRTQHNFQHSCALVQINGTIHHIHNLSNLNSQQFEIFLLEIFLKYVAHVFAIQALVCRGSSHTLLNEEQSDLFWDWK